MRLPPVDALLAIDIGNSRLGLGVWDPDGIRDVQRVPIAQPSAWPAAVQQTWDAVPAGERAVVLASVVPDETRRLAPIIEDICGLAPVCVRDDIPLPMKTRLDNAEEVGVDRVCSAAAAYHRIRGACAVASFGTATTIDCVARDGVFLGGTILPGLEMSCDVLHDRTAQLPRVKLAEPRGPFGRNTHDAIVNGVTYAAVGALREIVERFATELSEWPHLVVTGGAAGIVSRLAEFVDSVVPDLSLMGVALAYRKAAGQD